MIRTFTQDERDIVFDLWKQGAGFSDIGRVIDAKPGSIFTILREHGGIKPEKRKRSAQHLTINEREEIRAGLSAKMSIRAIARQLNRSASTVSCEISRNRGRRWYRAVNADRLAGKDSASVNSAWINVFNQLPAIMKKTLTWDRGMELAKHTEFTQETSIPVYFCDPQSPGQRGRTRTRTH
tara:strand:+ start:32260 stop:32802 length:543 start_codon:yes stop_codon:yes gene_type:complete